MESGAEWEDPSEDLLFELLSDIKGGGERSITVQHLDDRRLAAAYHGAEAPPYRLRVRDLRASAARL
jgi:hypothetical protein